MCLCAGEQRRSAFCSRVVLVTVRSDFSIIELRRLGHEPQNSVWLLCSRCGCGGPSGTVLLLDGSQSSALVVFSCKSDEVRSTRLFILCMSQQELATSRRRFRARASSFLFVARSAPPRNLSGRERLVTVCGSVLPLAIPPAHTRGRSCVIVCR